MYVSQGRYWILLCSISDINDWLCITAQSCSWTLDVAGRSTEYESVYLTFLCVHHAAGTKGDNTNSHWSSIPALLLADYRGGLWPQAVTLQRPNVRFNLGQGIPNILCWGLLINHWVWLIQDVALDLKDAEGKLPRRWHESSFRTELCMGVVRCHGLLSSESPLINCGRALKMHFNKESTLIWKINICYSLRASVNDSEILQLKRFVKPDDFRTTLLFCWKLLLQRLY